MTPCSQCGLILGMNAGVVSVNVAKASDASYARLGRSAMDKRPQDAPLWCSTLGLTGDECFDVKHHGGIDQAVYAFAREDLDWWVEQLHMPLSPGMFGENLTTSGIDVNEAEVGERWRVGEALLEIASVRIPCNDFKGWMGLNGANNRAWVKRFTMVGRPGPYLRVIEEGLIGPGDSLSVEHKPGHGVTVSTMFKALTTDPTLLPELLKVEGLVASSHALATRYVTNLVSKPTQK